MKKLKELLCILLPLIILTVIKTVYSILTFSTSMYSGLYYLRQYLSDPRFWISILYTYLPIVIISYIICILFMLIINKKRPHTTRKTVYLIIFVLSISVPIIFIFSVVSSTINILQVLYLFQSALASLFLFWITELLIQKIKAKKPTDE